MNLALDIGNTAVKWATFDGRTMTDHGHGLPADLMAKADSIMACASGKVPQALDDVPRLTADTPLPLGLDYKTPATLGPDRIADACGAWSLHPGKPSLVIDCGTCITLEFVSADGTYHGGAIMPGLAMSLRALNAFTEKLPLLDSESVDKAPLLGRSTDECILAGTLGAAQMALASFVASYHSAAPDLQVVVTGGDAQRIIPPGAPGRQHVPGLSLIGLNEIMIHNQ